MIRSSGINEAVGLVALIVMVAACVSFWGCVAGLVGGCASKPPLSADSFPASIAAQCERAKAAAIRQYGEPPIPFWHVEMKQGEQVGTQWAIKQGGMLVGGYTQGSYTVIGCGPNGEINYGDLIHEAGEYATWGDGRMHR